MTGVQTCALPIFGRCGDAADRVGGVDLDELAEDVDCFFVVGVSGLGVGEWRQRRAQEEQKG